LQDSAKKVPTTFSHPRKTFNTFLSPGRLFHSIACFVDGFDEDSRMLRRSLMRYMNLALILVLRSISSAVKQRFPTLEHVVEAGERGRVLTDARDIRSLFRGNGRNFCSQKKKRKTNFCHFPSH